MNKAFTFDCRQDKLYWVRFRQEEEGGRWVFDLDDLLLFR